MVIYLLQDNGGELSFHFFFFVFVFFLFYSLFFITWLKNINNQSSNLVETLPNLVGALILRRSDLGLPMDNFRQFLTWLSTWYATMMCVVSFYVGFLLLLLLLYFVVVFVVVVVFGGFLLLLLLFVCCFLCVFFCFFVVVVFFFFLFFFFFFFFVFLFFVLLYVFFLLKKTPAYMLKQSIIKNHSYFAMLYQAFLPYFTYTYG